MNAKNRLHSPISALVFDAYGTLFDVHSIALTAEHLFPGHGRELAQIWRSKQLEYTWLQSLMRSATQPRQDFAAITGHALEFAAQSLGLVLAAGARHRLLDSYLDLTPPIQTRKARSPRSRRCRASSFPTGPRAC